MSSPSSPNKRIQHITDIIVKGGGIQTVWNAILDINDWQWNKWTRLEANKVEEGTQGKLHASYEGNDEFETFDFTFAEVNHDEYILSWTGSFGPGGCIFRGYHAMRLEVVDGDSSTDNDNPHPTTTPSTSSATKTFGKMRRKGRKQSATKEDSATTTVRLIHTEDFYGALPSLWLGLPYKTLDRNYRLMNESLKAFIEGER